MTDQPLKHGNQHAPRLGPDGIRYAVWHIALSGDRDDDDPLIVEDNIFRPPVSWDMDTFRLKQLLLGAGVASSGGDVEIMIRNDTQGVDLLTGSAVLPAGDRYANCTSVIDDPMTDDPPPPNQVAEGDIIQFDVLAAGSDVKGLKAILVFW